jgi:hypothetical protein
MTGLTVGPELGWLDPAEVVVIMRTGSAVESHWFDEEARTRADVNLARGRRLRARPPLRRCLAACLANVRNMVSGPIRDFSYIQRATRYLL